MLGEPRSSTDAESAAQEDPEASPLPSPPAKEEDGEGTRRGAQGAAFYAVVGLALWPVSFVPAGVSILKT